MKIVTDFFNKLAKEIDSKYFPEVKYYRDNKNTEKIHRTIELFNNGCLTYTKLIERLADSCKETKENIHVIVSKYIEDFGGYEYKPVIHTEAITKKVIIIFGNITFHQNLVEEELALFKTNNEQKALIHSIDKIYECEANEKAVDKAIYDYETEAWLIPSEYKGEIVFEPNPDKSLDEVIAEHK